MPDTGAPHQTTWRTWAGLLICLIGALAFVWAAGGRPETVPPGTPYDFTLRFAGKRMLRTPISAEAAAAALWLRRLILPAAALAVGAFFLFLDTAPGTRFEAAFREWAKRRDED